MGGRPGEAKTWLVLWEFSGALRSLLREILVLDRLGE